MTATGAATPPPSIFLDDDVTFWSADRPDAPAMTYLSRTWTWSQFDDRIGRVASALAAAGVGRGDVVGFLDKNHPACTEVMLACSRLGAALAIFNWRSAGEELDYAINDSGARLLVVGTELMPTIESIRDSLSGVGTVVEVTPEGGDEDPYETWLQQYEPSGRRDEVRPEDPALVMYSSGTTGRPKGVVLSQANLVTHTSAGFDGFGFEEGSVNLVAMPQFHVGGTSYSLVGLRGGVPSVMLREPDGPSLIGAIMGGATHAFLVPAVAQAIMQAGEPAVGVFSKLHLFCYGAAPMPLPLLEACMQAWPDTDFMQVYGLTEVSGVATRLMPDAHRDPEHPERLVSAGTPMSGVEVRVVDPATQEVLPDDTPGEVWLRTPQLMLGYLGKPEATAEVITEDGWLRTGDVGRLVEGFLFVEDRIKDMIVTGGENVYSPEVERVIAEHPAVLEMAVIGVPDDKWGETVKAVVALKPGETTTAEDIIAHCRLRLAHYKCPTSIDIVEALPRNPTGKILKRDLRQPYWSDRARNIV